MDKQTCAIKPVLFKSYVIYLAQDAKVKRTE